MWLATESIRLSARLYVFHLLLVAPAQSRFIPAWCLVANRDISLGSSHVTCIIVFVLLRSFFSVNASHRTFITYSLLTLSFPRLYTMVQTDSSFKVDQSLHVCLLANETEDTAKPQCPCPSSSHSSSDTSSFHFFFRRPSSQSK